MKAVRNPGTFLASLSELDSELESDSDFLRFFDLFGFLAFRFDFLAGLESADSEAVEGARF